MLASAPPPRSPDAAGDAVPLGAITAFRLCRRTSGTAELSSSVTASRADSHGAVEIEAFWTLMSSFWARKISKA